MSRLITVLAALCSLALFFSPSKPPVALASSNQVAHVMIRLQGSPAASDPNFRDRSRTTSGRLRLDSSLASFRWYRDALSTYQSREITYLEQQGIDLKVTRQYSLLFNGFSATIPKSQVARLQKLGNVVSVTPIRRYYPMLNHSLPLVHAPEAWAQVGGPANAGKGLKIAQIDSGIDSHNPCFKDDGFKAPAGFPRGELSLTNNKVIVARAFGPQAGKSYDAADSGGTDSGHGTFGAAIEACNYNTPTPLGENISGMAPAAYLMNYNVFPGGSANDNQDVDPVLSALESALLDYPDVINMSLGLGLGAGDLRLDPDATAVGLVIQAGISVVVSAGNDGPTPQSVSSPAALPQAIAVGSTSNSRGVSASVLVNGPGDVPTNLQRIRADEMSHSWTGTVGPAQVVDVGLGRKPGDSIDDPKADDYAGKDVKGKIVLMERGNGNSANYIFIRTKIQRAQDAGAVGAIMYDNRQELNPGSPDQGKTTLQSMFISKSDGQALVQWVHDHPEATLTMDSSLSSYPETPNVLSDFSSRGYGANYAIKPDLVAPGQDIYSATETLDPSSSLYSPSGFISESGTSFSAPHVSGAAALVLQKHPKWTPDQVKSVLMDTGGFGISPGFQETGTPTVMQMGSGLLDINSALSSSAYLSPASVSFGEVNVGSGSVTKNATITLNNASSGDGTWNTSVHQLHGSPGVVVSVPGTVNLSGTRADVPIQVSVASNTPNGNYDGYVALTRNGETIHAVYFVHVVSNPVKPGTILLVDASTSLFQPPAPAPAVPHIDVAPWYEKTLTALGQSYTLWNEAILGTPSLADLKAASAVIYFTGTNLNDLSSENTNSEALAGPLSSADVTVMHSYMDNGGRLFVTGMGAPLSDPYWSGIVMGGVPSGDDLSVYDNSKNDKATKGGISPPQPSAVVAKSSSEVRNQWIFGGLKPIDFSTKGDGARTNLATFNSALAGSLGDGLIGVTGLVVIRGKNGFQGTAYGQGALQTTKPGLTTTGKDVAVVSSDEPSLGRKASHKGRSVMFSFGFEGINDNTGYATREQVMRRILQWLNDKPVARVTGLRYKAKGSVQLRASLNSEKAVQYRWQIGGRTLKLTSKPTQYVFSRPGKYRVRVQIRDYLGHVAVSGWTNVSVH